MRNSRLLAGAVILVLTGCANNGVSPGTAVPSVSPTGTAVGSPTLGASSTPGESPTMRVSPTSEATTRVRVTTAKARYRESEVIVATVANSLPEAIYGITGQTFCTIVTAQRREGSEWQAAGACTDTSPPGFIAIEPNSELAVEIVPSSASDLALSAGEYRIEFQYSVGSQGDPFHVVRSEVFASLEQVLWQSRHPQALSES